LADEIDFLQAQNQQLQQQKADAEAKIKAQQRENARRERAKLMVKNGIRLFAQGNYKRAADRFREAIDLSPDDPTPHFYLAQARFALRQYGEAAQSVKSGLRVGPDWLNLDFDMSTLYGDEKDLREQLAQLAGELRANPLERDALFLLGYELFVTGQKDKAKTLLAQSAKVEPNETPLKPFFDYFRKLPIVPRNAGGN
jgi:tetratricopeptide (TPR) repeat protein